MRRWPTRPREEYWHLSIVLIAVAALAHVFSALKKTKDKANGAEVFKGDVL